MATNKGGLLEADIWGHYLPKLLVFPEIDITKASQLRTEVILSVLRFSCLYAVFLEKMYQRVLQGSEKALGADNTSTLRTVNNLGALYADQGKLDEAEKMYQRALQGYEKALGADHTSTLLRSYAFT